MTIYNVLGVSCDVVDGEIAFVYTNTTSYDTKWQGEALVAHFPYASWGYMRSSQVCININNIKEMFKKSGQDKMIFVVFSLWGYFL